MARRYITLLPDITVMTLDGDRPYFVDRDGRPVPRSHRMHIKERCTDAAFVLRGHAGSCKAASILAAVEPLVPGDVLALDEEEWAVLKEAIETPKAQLRDGSVVATGYDGVAGPQLVSFGRAVLDASLEDPRKPLEVAKS
jgi:hypothetical protein